MNQVHIITRMDKENPISNYSSIYNLEKIEKTSPLLTASLYPIIKKMLLSTNFIYSHIKHRLFIWIILNALTLGFLAMICCYSYYELNGVYNLSYLSIGSYIIPIIFSYYYKCKLNESLMKNYMSRIAQFILNNENKYNDCFTLFIKDNFDLMVNFKKNQNGSENQTLISHQKSITYEKMNDHQRYLLVSNDNSCMRLINYVINIPRGLYSLSYFDYLLRIREKEIISEVLLFLKKQINKTTTSIFNHYFYPLIAIFILFSYIRKYPLLHLNEIYWLLGIFGALVYFSIIKCRKQNSQLLANYCQEKNKELIREGYYIYITELMISLFSINNIRSFELSVFAKEITLYLSS